MTKSAQDKLEASARDSDSAAPVRESNRVRRRWCARDSTGAGRQPLSYDVAPSAWPKPMCIGLLSLAIVVTLVMTPAASAQESVSGAEGAPAPLTAETDIAESNEVEPQGGEFTKFDALIAGLSIFVLAVFVGFEVITKVPPTLHTPLMSGSNAISGVTLVGALLVASKNDSGVWLGLLAVVFATINAIGGFWVTHRMLSMFQRK